MSKMLEPGQMLGAYRLMSRIGAGGMGEVWRAEDTRLGRIVAIKILPPDVAANPEATARMRREARTVAQLNHTNIATIHSFEEADGRTFIVMELVEGEPLSAIIARGPLPEAEVYRIGRGVADALVEAHAKDIIHRDIKPDNIIVSRSKVKVLDFGIAKRVGVEPMTSQTPTAFVTQEGMIVGTVHYMSPEQALGKPLDARTDIFSLGVVLYQAATGRQPFGGETITETITQIIRDTPPAPRTVNPSISAGLNSIIQRCLRKNRDERYASAADLAATLAAPPTAEYTKPAPRPPAAPTLVGKPTRSSAVWWVAGAVVLIAAIGAIAAHQWRVAPAIVPAASSSSLPVPSTAAVEVATVATESAAEAVGATQSVATAAEPTASEHFQRGMEALLNRNFGAAQNQLQKALDNPDDLTQRQKRFAHLGLALASGDRMRAQQIAREINAEHPNDPELERVKRVFAEEQPRRPFRPRVHR